MANKKILPAAALIGLLALLLVPTARAWAGSSPYAPPAGAPPTETPVPGTTTTYVVQPGDTLGGIALLYGIPLGTLLAMNPQITNPNAIQPGQLIYVPDYGISNYYPAYPYPSSYYLPPSSASPYRNLTVTYGHGLLVRSGPGIEYPEIKSQWVSAVKFSHWQYRKDSMTIDNIGFVWVEVKLSPLVTGYSTGWILARDSLGTYFTSPNIGPKIDLNDP